MSLIHIVPIPILVYEKGKKQMLTHKMIPTGNHNLRKVTNGHLVDKGNHSFKRCSPAKVLRGPFFCAHDRRISAVSDVPTILDDNVPSEEEGEPLLPTEDEFIQHGLVYPTSDWQEL